jgi:pimeloyl-ACP methyl ester carboxylesterase
LITGINDLKINYEILGEGKPVMLLHGWGGSLESLRALGSGLEGQGGLKVILIDLPGFGKSDRPVEDGFSLDDYAEVVEEFINQQDIQNPVLFGHSFGGAVSIKTAIRKNVEIQKLILCNSSGIRKAKSQQKTAKSIVQAFKGLSDLPVFKSIYPILRRFIYYYVLRNRDYIDHLDIAETFKKILSEDLTEQLSRIEVPTLLLWGENDKSTPLKHGKMMKLKIRNSKIKIFHGEGHGLPKFKPELIVDDIIDFLKRM